MIKKKITGTNERPSFYKDEDAYGQPKKILKVDFAASQERVLTLDSSDDKTQNINEQITHKTAQILDEAPIEAQFSDDEDIPLERNKEVYITAHKDPSHQFINKLHSQIQAHSRIPSQVQAQNQAQFQRLPQTQGQAHLLPFQPQNQYYYAQHRQFDPNNMYPLPVYHQQQHFHLQSQRESSFQNPPNPNFVPFQPRYAYNESQMEAFQSSIPSNEPNTQTQLMGHPFRSAASAKIHYRDKYQAINQNLETNASNASSIEQGHGVTSIPIGFGQIMLGGQLRDSIIKPIVMRGGSGTSNQASTQIFKRLLSKIRRELPTSIKLKYEQRLSKVESLSRMMER